MIFLIIGVLVIVFLFIHFLLLKENINMHTIFIWDVISITIISAICVGYYRIKEMNKELERELLKEYERFKRCECHFLPYKLPEKSSDIKDKILEKELIEI